MASESPDDAIHHFNNNALTFLNIGKALGDEMILAINDMVTYKNLKRQVQYEIRKAKSEGFAELASKIDRNTSAKEMWKLFKISRGKERVFN